MRRAGNPRAGCWPTGTRCGATAWARVEANQHYPSDVLVGLGLGHFMGSFFTHAFLGPARAETLQVVCGAPNVRSGMKAPFAMVGAKLPGGLDIRALRCQVLRLPYEVDRHVLIGPGRQIAAE